MRYYFLIATGLCAAMAWAAETVSVDANSNLGPPTYRASGLLLSLDSQNPADAWIAPLKPRLFRDLPATIATDAPRMAALGAQVQISLSGAFGYPDTSAYWPGDNGNWQPWLDLVAQQLAKARAAGQAYQWDVWNEPDDAQFWKRSSAQFQETWRRTVLQIRAADPQAVIVGPSLAGNDMNYLGGFLTYAKSNGVLPDILSWHAFRGPAATASELATIRQFLVSNSIAITRISVNEYVYQTEQFQPGTYVQYMAALERAGVEGAARSCYTEPTGTDDCFNASLGELLTSDSRRPRSAWWAHASYGALSGHELSLAPSASVDGLAAADPAQARLRILLGKGGGASGPVDIAFAHLDRLPYLVQGGAVQVLAEQIPDSGAAELAAPVVIANRSQAVEAGSLTVSLTSFGSTDAYRITLSPPAAQGLDAVQVYPNPLRPSRGDSAITFAACPAGTRLRLYTLAGEKVRDLTADSAGVITWDGRTEAGRSLASGVYLALLESAGARRQVKLAIQR